MDAQSLYLLLSLCFPLLLAYLLFYRSKNKHKGSDETPSIRPYPLLGHLPQFLKNLHRFHDWITDILAAAPNNTLVFHRLGLIRGVLTANPANVEHFLKSKFDNFPKGDRFRSNLEDFLGHGIFNADGHLWMLQRKTASFEFKTRSLRNFVVENVQQETATRLLPLLKRSADSGQVIDMQDVLERYAFDNVCKVAFNEDPACLADVGGRLSSFAAAFRDAAELSAGRFRYALPGFWKIKKVFDIGSERRLRESIATVHEFALQIIRRRMKERQMSSEHHAEDLLSRFIAIGEDYSEDFLRDIVISFVLAGRETTSSALSWFFWLLSSRPQVQHKVLDEITAVRSRRNDNNSDEQMFLFDELREMHYLHAAITESMRLYPPVPTNMTEAKQDETLPDGTEIKKGWFVSYNSYAMARMAAVWGEDCEEYKPERWLDEDGKFRPESPFKFVAFHAGPRMCLGKEMAYIQMKSIVASVLERFVIEVVAPPQQMLSLTLRMKEGLAVRVRHRFSPS